MLSEPPTDRTLMLRLRQDTAEAHQSIEKQMDMAAHLAHHTAYGALLAKMYGFHRPWESILSQAGLPAGFEVEQRRKSPMLKADLVHLGWTDAGIEALPACDTIPPVQPLPEMVGWMYVIEGSTLGGQIIARMIAEKLGLDAGHGAQFFGGYGPYHGTLWRRFGDAACRTIPEAEHTRVIAAANAAFHAMEDWMSR